MEQDNGSFTNYVPLEFTRDACDTVDNLNVGQEVEIPYRLNGRKWQKDPSSEVRFFVNLEATSFQVIGENAGNAAAANDQFAEAAMEEDDIPF